MDRLFFEDIKNRLQNHRKAVIEIIVKSGSETTKINTILADGSCKIDISSPPINGQANRELVLFLASELGVHRDNIKIIRGASAKKKLVMITSN